MQQSNILCFLLTVCRPWCIPIIILVEDLNIWFRRDLLSLILKWTFQELLIIVPLFAHKWRSKHYIIIQLQNNALLSIIDHDAIGNSGGRAETFLRNYSLYENNVDICNIANDILIPSFMSYHTCYPGTLIDSFNTIL
jgi:hypothetical protein